MRPANFQRWLLQALFGMLGCLAVWSPLLRADVEPSGMAPEIGDQRGFQPGNSYSLGEIETINPGNGNLLLHIPIATLPPGRGGSQAGRIGLFYNSKLYDSHRETIPVPNAPPPPSPQYYSRNVLESSEEGGWHYGFDYRLEMVVRDDEYIGVPANVKPNCAASRAYDRGTFQYKVKMAFPDGSKHEFRPFGFNDYDVFLFGQGQGYYEIRPDGWLTSCSGGALVTNSYTTGPMTYYSIDGTFLKLVIEHDLDSYPTNNPWTLYFPDGSRVIQASRGTFPDGTPVTLGNQRIYDRNNNYIEINNKYNPNLPSATTSIMDQMGRTIEIARNGSTDSVTTKGANGSNLTWTVQWGGTIVTKRYITPRSIGGPPDVLVLNTGFRVVTQITPPALPGPDQIYAFTYNPGPVDANGFTSGGWGELSSVTLPSGAWAEYQYDNDVKINIDYTWVMDNFPKQKKLHYIPGHDGVNQEVVETWTFALAGLRTSTSTITAPDAGVTSETYVSCCGPSLGYASTTARPDGTTIERVWKENIPYGDYSYPSRRVNAYVKTEFTSVKTSGGTNSSTAIKDYIYDKNGNPLQVVEYDWVAYSAVARSGGFPTGAIPGSAVVKKVVVNTYYNPTPDADQTNDDPNVYHKAGSPRLHNAIASSETRSSLTTTVGRTEYTYDDPATTGNLTLQRMWDSTKGTDPLNPANTITISHSYLGSGNRISTTDARGFQTKYTYDALDLYIIKKEEAFGATEKRTTTYTHDFSSGLVTSATDTDNSVLGDGGISTITQYDFFGRPLLVRNAVGRLEETQAETQYDDQTLRVVTLRKLDTSRKLVTAQQYDPLGRLRLQQQMEDNSSQDPASGIKVQTRHLFSGSNRYMLVSNPYRASDSASAGSESTMGWTRTKYDQAGKVLEVESFSGAGAPAPWGTNSSSTGKVTTAYESYSTLGRYTTVTDQASKQRRNIVDGLGRLVRVDEPNLSNSLGGITSPTQATSYTYDAFSNLTQVTQDVQTRTFTYSSLSRLTSAVNPESGTTSYTYDNNGNLLTKTDGRGVVKTFDPYDALNRVKRWTYNGGPPEARSTSEVTLSYDSCGNNSKGRLCSVTSKDSAGAVFSTSSYSNYDARGRAGQTSQTTNGQALPYTLSYSYNPIGMTSQTYPSGLMVKTGYDGAGRIVGVSNSDGSLYYVGAVETDPVNSMQYATHGGLQQMRVANGLWEETRYNARLQPLQIGLGRTQTALGSSLTQTNSDYLLLDYTYSSTQNNGNLLNQRIRVAAAGAAPALDLTQTYAYDTVNRLHTASETAGGGTAWSAITYDFDRFGNRAVTAGYKPVPGQTPVALTEFSTTTNRMVAPSVYDGTGNQTTDKGGCTTKYDGENKLVEFNCGLGITTYGYDGDGRRVQKVSGGLTTIYVHNVSGQLIAEYTSQGPTGTGISYLTADHLGSMRVVTDANRSVKARRDYLPFGEEIEVTYGGRSSIPGYGVTEGTRQRFTGKERDIESARDYFGARYFYGAQGRFTGVDPIWITKERMLDPQRLNLFAYGRNNPLRYIDPDGMDITLGACAMGNTEECFERLRQGLRKEDREHVHLVQGDGKNGFKKGEYGVTVDADYKSDSKNFQTLQKLASDHTATATIDVLKGDEKFDLKVTVQWDLKTGEKLGIKSTTANAEGGFAGYTIYAHRKGVPGPWSTGDFTDVIINADRGWVPSTIHHELRHVLLGDFGRVTPYGAHNTGNVDQETTEAEKEAVKNQTQALTNQR